jgi:hypothetical protein
MTNKELKSKAMTLGNRLALRLGGDRRAAFVEAWAIVKAGGLEVAVRGVSFGNRQEALRHLAPGKCAYLPVSGDRWIYVWEFHGQYVGATEDERRFIHVVEKEERPKRHQRKEILNWFEEPEPSQFSAVLPRKKCWIPSVPRWLLEEGPDMRPVYLAGGKPE